MSQLNFILSFIFGCLFMIGIVLNIRLIEIRDELRKMNEREDLANPKNYPQGGRQ